MSRIILLADVHLTADESPLNNRFIGFLKTLQQSPPVPWPRPRALFILGDLFDVWLGDDSAAAGTAAYAVARELAAVNQSGTPVFLQHGNRDFMLGARFCRQSRASLLPPAYVLHADGEKYLLMHGDELTAEKDYLRYRRIIRHPLTTAALSALPLFARRRLAAKLRAASRGSVLQAAVCEATATAALTRHGCRRLIHGHLHKKMHARWAAGGAHYQRWCLPPWDGGVAFAEINGGEMRFNL